MEHILYTGKNNKQMKKIKFLIKIITKLLKVVFFSLYEWRYTTAQIKHLREHAKHSYYS